MSSLLQKRSKTTASTKPPSSKSSRQQTKLPSSLPSKSPPSSLPPKTASQSRLPSSLPSKAPASQSVSSLQSKTSSLRTKGAVSTEPEARTESSIDPDSSSTNLLLIITLVSVCVIVILCLIVIYWFIKKKQGGNSPKIGQVLPETPEKVIVEGNQMKHEIDSIESLGEGKEDEIFTIETNGNNLDHNHNRANSSDEILTKSGNKMDPEGADPRSASEPRNTGNSSNKSPSPSKRSMKFKTVASLTGKLGGFGLSSAKEKKKKDKMDKYNKMPKQSLTLPVEGEIPFHGDVDLMSGDSDSDEEEEDGKGKKKGGGNGDSGFVDSKQQQQQRSVTPDLINNKSGAKSGPSAAVTTFSSITSGRLSSAKNMAGNIFAATKKLTESSQSTYKRTGGRCKSAGIQTEQGSTINIPGLVDSPDSGGDIYLEMADPEERKYFVYLVSDSSSSYFKKDCIGRLRLPNSSNNWTLFQLRNHLLKSDDELLRSILKANKSFRFVTETYRFVAQNEAVAAIEEVYSNQGIFIKFGEGSNFTTEFKHMAPSGVNTIGAIRRRSMKGGTRNLPAIGAPTDHAQGGGGRGFRRGGEMRMGRRRSSSGLDPTNSDLPPIQHFKNPHMSHKDKEMYENQKRDEILRRRHIECTSPLPLKYKEAQRKGRLLCLDIRKICDSPMCKNRAVFRCTKCSTTAYCSAKCKKDNWFDHRLICSRPPWRF